MHDPMVVAFEIRRPWPARSNTPKRDSGKRWEWTIHRKHGTSYKGKWNPRQWWRPGAWSPFVTAFGRAWYFPSLITIWHVEPDGADSGEVCKHSRRWQDEDGKWHAKYLKGWKWHVHHWKIQISPVQQLRRWLFQRCNWCGGPSRKGHEVNISHQWNSKRAKPWWTSAPDLYHSGCSSAVHVAKACLCDVPLPDGWNGAYGTCATCGGFYRGEASWTGTRQAIAISGMPEEGKPWAWPKEIDVHEIRKVIDARNATSV